ncbi:hypothetical protein JCM3766R1_004228 [Sporobolomyces carnicolor]
MSNSSKESTRHEDQETKPERSPSSSLLSSSLSKRSPAPPPHRTGSSLMTTVAIESVDSSATTRHDVNVESTPEPIDSKRGASLKRTALEIQSGTIGGGFGPYPAVSPGPRFTRRALHSSGSDSAIDLGPLPTSTRSPPPPFVLVVGGGGGGLDQVCAVPVSPLSLAADDTLLDRKDDFDFSEDDDDDDKGTARNGWTRTLKRKTWFELADALALFAVVASFVTVLLVYPALRYGGALGTWSTTTTTTTLAGRTNSSGQVPRVVVPGLVDLDTPETAMTRNGFFDDSDLYHVVFSDEFNRDGRTFWPGDDPFWEAVDLHYWQTQDYEWYDPDAATTRDGHLEITLSEEPTNGLNFRSAMVQLWNKFCFQGGIVEVSMSSPGDANTMGFWPGVWTLGNLGRAGYGASNDGVWPYSYDSCDVGTLANQSFSNHTPAAAHGSGLRDYGGQLSYLRGQRFSSCTCPGEDHPGPDVSVGRGAPEIDVTEQQVDWRGTGSTSQSIQFAPMDAGYEWLNTTPHTTIFDPERTFQNTFQGATFQESASVITLTDTTSYDGKGFTRYGFEYEPGPDGRITWFVNDTASWRILASAIGPNQQTGIGQRLIATEPLSINLNLAISKAFQTPNWANLTFPAVLRIDYIRVYQKGSPKIGCDPPDHPTSDYINRHLDLYTNPNLTRFPGEFPRNRISDQGCLE